jgi:hypothetical protein
LGLDCALINQNFEELEQDVDYESDEEEMVHGQRRCAEELTKSMKECEIMGLTISLMMLKNQEIE